MDRRKKNPILTVVISVLICTTLFSAYLFWINMKELNSAYADKNSIEFLSASTQRLINLATSDQMDQRVLFVIGDSTNSALLPEGDSSLSVLSQEKIVLLADDVLESWHQIQEILEEEEPNFTNLALARDAHFKAMTNLSNAINDHGNALSSKITQYQAIVLASLFAIGMVMFNNTLRTHTELKINRLMAETAQIDSATGLYNRSRCQELFKSPPQHGHKHSSGIIVLDLNDLKKTNDSQGHRVGDELIHSFALVLKKAAEGHSPVPFMGRYGGDEFIIYYDTLSGEEEIHRYLEELRYATDEFNQQELRFQISYAAGHAFHSSHASEKQSTRQLFDLADSAMYENKIAGKRAKNPNYDQEAKNGEVR